MTCNCGTGPRDHIFGKHVDCEYVDHHCAECHAKHFCTKAECRVERASALLKQWQEKQGHDRCWYYPEIFEQLCELFDVESSAQRGLPPRAEFEEGCRRYQEEQYK